ELPDLSLAIDDATDGESAHVVGHDVRGLRWARLVPAGVAVRIHAEHPGAELARVRDDSDVVVVDDDDGLPGRVGKIGVATPDDGPREDAARTATVSAIGVSVVAGFAEPCLNDAVATDRGGAGIAAIVVVDGVAVVALLVAVDGAVTTD